MGGFPHVPLSTRLLVVAMKESVPSVLVTFNFLFLFYSIETTKAQCVQLLVVVACVEVVIF